MRRARRPAARGRRPAPPLRTAVRVDARVGRRRFVRPRRPTASPLPARLASRASDELTCQTAPSRTPTASSPSRPASRLPNRCLSRTAAPSPIGATLMTSSAAAPRSVSPSSHDWRRRRPVRRPLGRPAVPRQAAAGRASARPACRTRSSGRGRLTSSALAAGARSAPTRPLRLSLSLTSSESPGNARVLRCLCSGRRALHTLPVPIARTSAAAISAAAARKRARWCAHGPSPPRRLLCRRWTVSRLLPWPSPVKS